MCAYFFKVSHDNNINELKTNEELQKLKALITNAHAKEFPEGVIAKFNRNNSQHISLINYCTLTAQQKLLNCQAADKEAASFLAIGLITFSTGFIPFSWVIAPLALLYSGYLMKERSSAYDEYTAALNDLHRCGAWALNNKKGSDYEGTTQDDIDHHQITTMLGFLTEVMTKEQLKGIIVDGDLEDTFIKNIAVNDDVKKETLTYMIYGYDQKGSLSDVALKIKDYMQHVCSQLVSAAVEYNNSSVTR